MTCNLLTAGYGSCPDELINGDAGQVLTIVNACPVWTDPGSIQVRPSPVASVIAPTDNLDGTYTINAPSPLDDGEAFDASDFGRLVVSSCLTGATIFDSGVVVHGSAIANTYVSGTVGGAIVFDRTLYMANTGANDANPNCFHVQYTPYNDLGLSGGSVSCQWAFSTSFV